MCGIIAPGTPRVMQRSHKPKSSRLSKGIGVEAAGRSLPGVDDALDPGVLKRDPAVRSAAWLPPSWRNLPVWRIDDQPRATALRDLERVAELERPNAGRALDHLRVSFSRTSASSAPATSSTRRPANWAGRSSGVLCSYLFV